MFSAIVNACKSFFHQIKETIKNFTKPETAVLAAGAGSDITRSRKDLVSENAILRQQLTGDLGQPMVLVVCYRRK